MPSNKVPWCPCKPFDFLVKFIEVTRFGRANFVLVKQNDQPAAKRVGKDLRCSTNGPAAGASHLSNPRHTAGRLTSGATHASSTPGHRRIFST